MAMGAIECYLGFSTAYTNRLTEVLERDSRTMSRQYREAYVGLMLGCEQLHDAVEHALGGDRDGAERDIDSGLGQLAITADRLTGLGEALVAARTQLAEQSERDPADPLIARERFFAAIDFDALYRRLHAQGAALPARVFWDELCERVRADGARGGLRLLDRLLRGLQSTLTSFVDEVRSLRRLPTPELPHRLHATGLEIAALTMGFTRLLTTFTYLSMVCDEAMRRFEDDVPSSREVAVAV